MGESIIQENAKLKVDPPKARIEKAESKPNGQVSGDVLEEFFSGQLQCAICKEIYIHPTVLNCGHIYCYACINHWHVQKHAQAHNCPMCRSDIIFFTRNPVLHVFVEKFIDTFFQNESKRARRKIVAA